MYIGEPVRTVIVTPEKLPIPEREPDFLPDHKEVPVEEPQKVSDGITSSR